MHKKFIFIIVVFLLFSSCGNNEATSSSSEPLVLNYQDMIFIENLEQQLGYSLNIDNMITTVEEALDEFTYLRIQAMDLSDLNLINIPPSIGDLDSLSYLNLENNILESLPDTICSLSLDELELNNNSICQVSSIPECVSQFYDIMDQNCIAYPDENDTDFLIELMNMNAINDTTFDLIYNNRVTWEIKLDEGSLVQRIVKLDLDNLALDTIPISIGNLEYLRWIELENNNLTAIPEQFGSLIELWYLDIYNNNISDIPVSLQNLSNLRELYIYNNNIEELDLNFSYLVNLEKLWINNNQIEYIDSSICEIVLDLEFYYNDNKLCQNLPLCLTNIDVEDQNCDK